MRHDLLQRLAIIGLLGSWLIGCAQIGTQASSEVDSLAKISQLNVRLKQSCIHAGVPQFATRECQRLARQIERMFTQYPRDRRVLMANAWLYYARGDYETAAFVLDQLLTQPGSFVEATIMRVNISVTQGNFTRARSLLRQQIQSAPASAGLYEALASVDYLTGDYIAAKQQLRRAGMLGAPGWRVNYHQGLVLEATGNQAAACQAYAAALRGRPSLGSALARMINMSDVAECSVQLKRRLERQQV